MPTLTFYEHESLPKMLNTALAHLSIESDVDTLLSNFSLEEIELANHRINEILEKHFDSGEVSIRQVKVPENFGDDLGLRIWKSRKEGEIKSLKFISLQGSKVSWLISLAAVTWAIVSGAIAGVLPLSGFLWAFYLKFSQLTFPDDKVAIDCYEALLKIQLTKKNSRGKSATTRELVEMLPNYSEETIISGLNKLRDRSILKVIDWGEEESNYNSLDNSWTQII